MDVMHNKVTRRIALGSIAAGLGGAALAIRALKGRYNVNVPERYETEWGKYVKMFDVPIREIEGPSTFTLDLTPQIGMKYRVNYFCASYGPRSYPARYPEPPFWYTVADGQVAVVSPIVDDRPALLISIQKQLTKGRVVHGDKLGGECVVVPKNGDLDYFDVGHGVPKRVPLGKVNLPCARVAAGLMFGYPKGKALAKGTKWTTPETSSFSIELPCEIVGFAEVARRETAKIVAERQLNNQEVQHYIRRSMQRVKKIEKERGSSFDADAEMKSDLEEAIAEKSTRSFRVTGYVDLKTGLTVRHELSTTVHRPKATNSDQTMLSITQSLES